jgi:hypothetical protein
MKIKRSNMSYFAPSLKSVLSRRLLVLAVNDFRRRLPRCAAQTNQQMKGTN